MPATGKTKLRDKSLFICHASANKRFVRRLVADLERAGLKVWIDEEAIRVGQSILGRIQSGLRTSRNVIVVVSKISLKRPWVKAELAEALHLEYSSRKNFVLPVLYEKVRLPAFLRDKKHADFSKSYNHGLEELLHAIDADLPRRGNLIRRQPETSDLRTIKSEILIDLADATGHKATYRRVSHFIPTRGDVRNYKENFGSDGVVKNISFFPGQVKKKEQIDGRVTYEVTFDRTYKKGQEFTLLLQADLRNAFREAREHWTVLCRYPTEELTIKVIFNQRRNYKTFEGLEIDAHKSRRTRSQPRPFISEGRSGLRWTIRKPTINNDYRITWTW